jgi:GDP-L-fucose synthase
MSAFWAKRRVVVTGGTGFLGGHMREALARRGAGRSFFLGRRDYDLTNLHDVRRMYYELRPDVVIHLAAVVGGIGANRRHPGKYFYENLMMGAQLLEEARRAALEKFVAVGTICAYPKFTPVPFREDDLWNGYPEETNAPYGVAKKAMLVQAQAYRQEYGLNAIYLLPVNLYGPGDNFDPESSHVIPALIRKCVEAQQSGAQEVVAWGSGQATREFLYAADAAEGILLAAERYDDPEPVNLGTGEEISIAQLAAMIATACGYAGKFRWDTAQPDGQPHRCLDTSRARERFGFQATTRLPDGLARTVAWYRQVYCGDSGPAEPVGKSPISSSLARIASA